MKRVLKLGLILLITIFIMGNVYAAFSCEMTMQATKTQVSKNEEFTVNINVSNIQSERGIISLGGTLEYDKESLELVKMEGKNGWETPINGASYNANNGKIAITRSGLGKENETVFSITFKVKEASKENPVITFKDITAADGTTPAKIAQVSQKITVSNGTSNPPTTNPGDNTTQNPSTNTNVGGSTNNNKTNTPNTNGSSTDNKKNNTTTNTTTNKKAKLNGVLPKAGTTQATVLIICITVFVLVTAFFLIKIKIINKKMNK